MKLRIIFLCFALAVLLQNSLAVSSNVDMNISQTSYYIKAPQNITFKFNFTNLRDDDSAIDRVDFYILDLKTNNIDFVAYAGSNWQHEYIARFNDDHFWITNASGQSLEVTVKPNMTAEGEYLVQGYFQFFDQTGSIVGLGDNRPILPLADYVDHVFAKIIIDNTPPTVAFTAEPVWTSTGLSIEASVDDANPISIVRLSYNSPTGNKTITMSYSRRTKIATATIPLADIKEGTQLNYTATATDAARNQGSASKTFTAADNPQITLVHPDTLLPQVAVKLFAKITDTSGIGTASVKFTQNSKLEKTVQMVKGSNDVWSVELGSFEKGTKIDYAITAADTLGNPGIISGSFSILNEYSLKFNVIDAVLKTPVQNVTLTVSSRTVTSYGTNFVIPEKTITFNDSTSIKQLEGKYYFTFSNPSYPDHKFFYDIQADFEKTIMLGTGAQSQIKSASISPRISDDNQSFYLDITATIQEAYPLKTLRLVYSTNSNLYDKIIELSKSPAGDFRAVLGPFQDQIVLYSKLELVDASEQVVVYDLGVRWYSLLTAAGGIGVGVEICGNGTDDNNNGLVDEGCPCNENDSQACSKNVGVCKEGIQKCVNNQWSEICDGGIIPSPEICGNKLDDDCDNIADNGCFVDSDNDALSDEQEEKLGTDPRNPDTDEDNVNDGQEVLYDDTDALNPKSNKLYIELKSQLSLGDSQEIRLMHPTLGVIKGIEAVVIAPSGQETRLVSNDDGAVIFKPAEEGTYSVKIIKKKFESAKTFTASPNIFSVTGTIGGVVSYVFGETATEAPWQLIIALILAVLVGFVANSQLKSLLRPKKILSTSEERKELIKRAALVILAALVPLALFRLSGFASAILAAFALVIISFVANYAISQKQGKKAVRVVEEKASKDFVGKMFSRVKGLFFEAQAGAEIKPTKEWKKIDWQFEKSKEKQQAAETVVEAKEPSIETISAQARPEEKQFEYFTPETAPSYESAVPESTKSVEVWKRFEPVEFEERMTEIGKEVEKTLEKKLLEVGDEIEKRVGKKLQEVEEEVDRRVSRRLLETEEEVERRIGRKLAEVEEDVDRKLKKRMEEMEEKIGEQVEKKLETERAKRKQKTITLERLKKQAFLKKIMNEELQKAEKLQTQASRQAQQTGFVLKETKQPTALVPQKTEELQALSKDQEQRMQELVKQLAVLNSSFEKGLVSKEEFEAQAKKLMEELQKAQKQ